MPLVAHSDTHLNHPVQAHHGSHPKQIKTTLSQKKTLKLLSFNIQLGIAATRPRHYLTRSWRHLLPHASSLENLDNIAQLISHFDIVALQEVDAGSFRSQYTNQIEYLAMRGHYPYWYAQTNRDLGRLAQHSNGLLSQIAPQKIFDHKLPGIIPGRGAIEVHYGPPGAELVMIIVHLGLGRRVRLRQLEYVSTVIKRYPHVIVMGDFNCQIDSAELQFLINSTPLCNPETELHTFPSWRPQRNIDHILTTSSLKVEQISVISPSLSDHLPIMVEINIPDELHKKWCALEDSNL